MYPNAALQLSPIVCNVMLGQSYRRKKIANTLLRQSSLYIRKDPNPDSRSINLSLTSSDLTKTLISICATWIKFWGFCCNFWWWWWWWRVLLIDWFKFCRWIVGDTLGGFCVLFCLFHWGNGLVLVVLIELDQGICYNSVIFIKDY